MSCGFNPNASILAGVPTVTLQQWLLDAQTALAKLSTGTREMTIIVTGGGQHREVTYAKSDMGSLTQWIGLLQAQLGLINRPRRAIGLSF